MIPADGCSFVVCCVRMIDDYIYPYWFYQFPELLPDLAVAYGISPPQGVLRMYGPRMLQTLYWICTGCGCWKWCSKGAKPTSGSPDDETSTTSSSGNLSTLPSHNNTFERDSDLHSDDISLSFSGYGFSSSSPSRQSSKPAHDHDPHAFYEGDDTYDYVYQIYSYGAAEDFPIASHMGHQVSNALHEMHNHSPTSSSHNSCDTITASRESSMEVEITTIATSPD